MKTIQELASDAGFREVDIFNGEFLAWPATATSDDVNVGRELLRFAALVKAQALEEAALECEKICDESAGSIAGGSSEDCVYRIRELVKVQQP